MAYYSKSQLDAMEKLGFTDEEIKQMEIDDKAVDKMSMKELSADLTEEEKKIVKAMTKASTRQTTVYNFSKRERKENPTKGSIIAEIAQFLKENSENACENVEITNKERQIAFKVGENDYEITLIQKRKPKK